MSSISAGLIDLSESQTQVSAWASSLTFKPKQTGKHFNKHKTDASLTHIRSADEYVKAAQENIVHSLFHRGFAIRTAAGNKVAFFTTRESDFPDKMTVIGSCKGVGKINTFYSANMKTPYLTTRTFADSAAYIAIFSNGISEKGWQRIMFDPRTYRFTEFEESPKTKLDDSVDFIFTKALQTKEPIAKLLAPEKTMILGPFLSGSLSCHDPCDEADPGGSAEEHGRKPPQKGVFAGAMSFAIGSNHCRLICFRHWLYE